MIPAAILLVHPVLPAPYFPAVLPVPFPTVLPAPFPSLCHKNRIRYILHCVLVYVTRQNCSRDPHRDALGGGFIAILLTAISSEPSCNPSCNPSCEPSCEPSCNSSCGTARASFQPLSINRIAAETHRDAPGDVFIAILLTVISFDPSYDPSSEPSCEPSCNPSCGTARASFQPLSINRIAADNSVGRGWAAEHAQFCFRSSPPIIPKKNLPLESTRNSWVNTEGEIRAKSRP